MISICVAGTDTPTASRIGCKKATSSVMGSSGVQRSMVYTAMHARLTAAAIKRYPRYGSSLHRTHRNMAGPVTGDSVAHRNVATVLRPQLGDSVAHRNLAGPVSGDSVAIKPTAITDHVTQSYRRSHRVMPKQAGQLQHHCYKVSYSP